MLDVLLHWIKLLSAYSKKIDLVCCIVVYSYLTSITIHCLRFMAVTILVL